jgi:hypothetical protein
MPRRRRLLLPALCSTLAATALAGAAPAPAAAAPDIRVGVGDQSIAMFDHAEFKELDLRQVRYFVPWNVMGETEQRHRMRAYVKKARSEGMRPLIHVSTTTFDEKKAPRPSVARYRKDVGRLVRYLRGLGVRDFGTFNEANHKTQPTWDSPNHAALFFQEMYRAVHERCSTRSCRVVALDVLDQPGVERYIRRFYDRLRSRTWQRRAKFVGIHNYSDVNRDSRTRTRGIIKEVRRHNRGARFWFTETGGLVGFGKNFPCDPSSPASLERAEKRAADAVGNVFDLARTYRSSGVQRIYLYNWFGNDCAPNDRTELAGRASDERAGFDAGLVRQDGTPRPGLSEVRRALRGSFSR